MNTHRKCGLPIKSAIAGEKHKESRFIHPSMPLVFWFPHHLSQRIQPGKVDIIVVVAVIVVVVVVVDVLVVVVVVVQ